MHQFVHEHVGPRLIPMIVSPYLSPESQSICTNHNVAYLDFVGNAYLSFENVYIERTVAEKPKSETRALRSIFSPRAGAILRVLLRDLDRTWRVAELAEEANASFGRNFTANAQENDYFALYPLLRSFKYETTRRFDFVWKLTIF